VSSIRVRSQSLDPRRCQGWIFDLDGTLTVPQHDFDAIRAELGLPKGRPILEALGELPGVRARPLARRLHEIEHGLALSAQAAPGAAELLLRLMQRRARLGVLTRNAGDLARLTLASAGLAFAFDAADVLGREAAAPKPDPEGVTALLSRWNLAPACVVVVGDFLFDLQAGRAAGTAAVWVDHEGGDRFGEHCDLRVRSLTELCARVAASEHG